ncbi:MAG: hypothetical protein ACREMY_19860, partial [bacterium]
GRHRDLHHSLLRVPAPMTSDQEILEAMWALPLDAPLLDRLIAFHPRCGPAMTWRTTWIRALCAMANRPLPWKQEGA